MERAGQHATGVDRQSADPVAVVPDHILDVEVRTRLSEHGGLIRDGACAVLVVGGLALQGLALLNDKTADVKAAEATPVRRVACGAGPKQSRGRQCCTLRRRQIALAGVLPGSAGRLRRALGLGQRRQRDTAQNE